MTAAAQKRFESIKARPELPPWWTALQVASVTLLCLYLIYAILSDSGKATSSTPDLANAWGPGGNPPVTAPVDPAEPAPEQTSEPGAPATGNTTLTLRDGTTVSFPADAAAQARAAALGIFTGDFVGVRVRDTRELPAIAQRYPAAQIVGIESAATKDDTAFVAFTVDPDGAGPETPRANIRIFLADLDTGWTWVVNP